MIWGDSARGVFLLTVFLQGCATLADMNTETFRKDNQTRLQTLSIGMTKDIVMGTMGTDVVYQCLESRAGLCIDREAIPNPYRRSYFSTNGKRYEVLYYYTDDEPRELLYHYRDWKKHGIVLRDENLTPVVLEDGKVIGWGTEFLEHTAQSARLEVR